ncbi:MAG: hypothetical protein IJE58_00105 [Oscillospiraceae bacterium]|nr:hypothetical protein [Oscillospiraceae bacterium]
MDDLFDTFLKALSNLKGLNASGITHGIKGLIDGADDDTMPEVLEKMVTMLQAEKNRSNSKVALISSIATLSVASIGFAGYSLLSRKKKAEREAEAQQIIKELQKQLSNSAVIDEDPTEAAITTEETTALETQ